MVEVKTTHAHYIPAEHGDREWLLLRADTVVERMSTPRDDGMCPYCFADNLLSARQDIDLVAAVVGRRSDG